MERTLGIISVYVPAALIVAEDLIYGDWAIRTIQKWRLASPTIGTAAMDESPAFAV
jgi:hypothetical protein